jgi:endonuclease YncB( thermonuclease family)
MWLEMRQQIPISIFARFLFLTLLLLTGVIHAQVYEGRVVGVLDGDTLVLLTPEKRQVKVRLAQIDAPEKSQAFGQRSKQSLSDLVFGKQVRVEQQDNDRYGRVVGRVSVGSVDANAEQVKRGMAWVYRKYARDRSLFTLEEEAKSTKRGLWADPHTIPPWEYRHGGKWTGYVQIQEKAAAEKSKISVGLSCGAKRYCKEMTSCDEARFYLTQCRLTRLDSDGDGVPCEALCK